VVAQVVPFHPEDFHELEVAEGGRDFPGELISVQPHLLHQLELAEAFRDRTREVAVGERK